MVLDDTICLRPDARPLLLPRRPLPFFFASSSLGSGFESLIHIKQNKIKRFQAGIGSAEKKCDRFRGGVDHHRNGVLLGEGGEEGRAEARTGAGGAWCPSFEGIRKPEGEPFDRTAETLGVSEGPRGARRATSPNTSGEVGAGVRDGGLGSMLLRGRVVYGSPLGRERSPRSGRRFSSPRLSLLGLPPRGSRF